MEVLAAVGIDPMDPSPSSIAMQGLVAADFGTRFLHHRPPAYGAAGGGVRSRVARDDIAGPPAGDGLTLCGARSSDSYPGAWDEQRAASARGLTRQRSPRVGPAPVPSPVLSGPMMRGRGLVAGLNLPSPCSTRASHQTHRWPSASARPWTYRRSWRSLKSCQPARSSRRGALALSIPTNSWTGSQARESEVTSAPTGPRPTAIARHVSDRGRHGRPRPCRGRRGLRRPSAPYRSPHHRHEPASAGVGMLGSPS